MKKKMSDIILGSILIILGIIFLGNEFDFWNIKLFFKGWWTLFIIVPSALGIWEKENRLSSFFGLLIGLLLLFAARDIIAWKTVGKIFLPVLLVTLGLSMIFRKNFKVQKSKNKETMKKYTAIFAGAEEKISNEEFLGTNVIAVFGGVELDLRQAIIKNDIVINCEAVFGGIDIILPDNVKVITSGVPVFGGVENKKESAKEENIPTVYINYVCVFAGVDIK